MYGLMYRLPSNSMSRVTMADQYMSATRGSQLRAAATPIHIVQASTSGAACSFKSLRPSTQSFSVHHVLPLLYSHKSHDIV